MAAMMPYRLHRRQEQILSEFHSTGRRKRWAEAQWNKRRDVWRRPLFSVDWPYFPDLLLSTSGAKERAGSAGGRLGNRCGLPPVVLPAIIPRQPASPVTRWRWPDISAPFIRVSIINALINAANLLFVLTYFTTDMLRLRLLSVVATSCVVVYFYSQPEPLMTVVAWNVVFLALNVVQLALMLRSRWPRLGSGWRDVVMP